MGSGIESLTSEPNFTRKRNEKFVSGVASGQCHSDSEHEKKSNKISLRFCNFESYEHTLTGNIEFPRRVAISVNSTRKFYEKFQVADDTRLKGIRSSKWSWLLLSWRRLKQFTRNQGLSDFFNVSFFISFHFPFKLVLFSIFVHSKLDFSIFNLLSMKSNVCLTNFQCLILFHFPFHDWVCSKNFLIIFINAEHIR